MFSKKLKCPVNKRSKPGEVAVTLNSIAQSMESKPIFADPPVSYASMRQVAADISSEMSHLAYLEAQAKQSRERLGQLKDKGVLQVIYNGNYVFQMADGDESLIYAAHYGLVAGGSSTTLAPDPPTNVNAEPEKGAGRIKVWCDSVGRGTFYEVQLNEVDPNDEMEWRTVHKSKSCKAHLTGLPSITKVWVRIIVTTSSGTSSPSKVQDCVVP